MTLTLKRASHGLAHAVLAASTLLAAHGTAAAQDKPAPAASAASAAPAKDRKDDRALAVLKRMSDTLAGAKTLSFKVRGIVPTPAPTGQYVSLYASSSVVMQRPDKMFVAARGDLFPSDAWYDGKKVTVVGRDNRFYAQRDAEGGPLEALMNATQPASDATAPFLDLLVTDPYTFLTKDFTSALWVGQTQIAGVQTDHLAFTAPGLDWEIWIGTADKLPRLMVVSYRTGERQPTFTVELSDWKLDPSVPAKTFVASIPKDAIRIEFKQIGETK
jgi:hypothetical protein